MTAKSKKTHNPAWTIQKIEDNYRSECWEKLKGLYAQLHKLRPYSCQVNYPRSIAECVELVNFLTVAIDMAIDEQKKEQVFTGIAKCSVYSPTKLITFTLFKLSINWLKCYICCLAESLIDHLNGNTGGWNDRQLLLPSHHRYKKVSLCEEMEIWHKYQDFELTEEDQPIFQRIIQAV